MCRSLALPLHGDQRCKMEKCQTSGINAWTVAGGTRSVPATSFEFFDPHEELQIRKGKLPHWYQPGVTYFVTFRTEDSVPQDLLRTWHVRRDDWLRRHGIDPALPHWKLRLAQDRGSEREFHTTFSREFMEYLDRGYGCVLRESYWAEIVANSLRSFDSQRYRLGNFVVMPNHVDLLVCLFGIHGDRTTVPVVE